MKKKFIAAALAVTTLLSLGALGACKKPTEPDDQDDVIIPAPEPVDGLTLIAGNWKIESVQTQPSESGDLGQDNTMWDWYSLQIEADCSFVLNHFDGQTDHTYQGKAENADTLYYYTFSCTINEITVRADAYLYPDGNTLSFSSISCEGGSFTQNYSGCTCVRAN